MILKRVVGSPVILSAREILSTAKMQMIHMGHDSIAVDALNTLAAGCVFWASVWYLKEMSIAMTRAYPGIRGLKKTTGLISKVQGREWVHGKPLGAIIRHTFVDYAKGYTGSTYHRRLEWVGGEPEAHPVLKEDEVAQFFAADSWGVTWML